MHGFAFLLGHIYCAINSSVMLPERTANSPVLKDSVPEPPLNRPEDIPLTACPTRVLNLQLHTLYSPAIGALDGPGPL